MARYTLFRNGDLISVSSDDIVVSTFNERGFDLTREGMKTTMQDRQTWLDKHTDDVLSKVPKNPRFASTGGHSKNMRAKVKTTVQKMPGRPQIGVFKPLQESPALSRWLEQNGRLFAPAKRGLMMRRLWQVLTGACAGKTSVAGLGSNETFKQVLAILFVSDPVKFAEAAFNHSVLEAATHDSIEVPEVLRPMFDLCTKVDGRGEVLAAFMFNDVAWMPGTGRFDLTGEPASVGNWHVKEAQSNRNRMGSNSYSTSKLCSRLVALKDAGKLVMTGRVDPTHTISDEFVALNTTVLEAEFANEGGFRQALNATLAEAEVESRGTIFFKSNKAVVRYTCDIECIGATKGDLVVRAKVSPSKLPQQRFEAKIPA